MRKLTVIAVLLVAAALAAGAVLPWPRPQLAPRPASALPLARVAGWGLQLQNVLPLAIPSDIDLLVVDDAQRTQGGHPWTRERVEALRRRDGRPDRIVLAYLSIGEAESYRHYWRPAWTTSPPGWLGAENASWRGNFAVRYWQPGWQNLIVGATPTVLSRLTERFAPRRRPFIDRILEAGFDGVYLDRVDAFDDWAKERGEATARADMVAFVHAIATYARERRPGFLVVPQNGEELIAEPGFVAAIDGFAKEDLLYGSAREGADNDGDAVSESAALLDRVKAAGKPVLVVEYLPPGDPRRSAAVRSIRTRGFIPALAGRALDEPPEAPPPAPARTPVGLPTAAPSTAGMPAAGPAPAPADTPSR